MKRMIVLLSGALALVSLAGASSVEAQSVETFKSSDTRVTGYFTLQGCCEGHVVDRDAGTIDFGYDFDLDPSFGFGLRAERKVADYMAIGGMFEFLAWEADIDDDREFFMDLDIFLKVLHEISLSGSMGLEIYALAPFGFTAGFVDDDDPDDDLTGFGINLGLLAGAMLLIGKIGIIAELGFRHRSVWDEVNGRDFRLGVNQIAFNLGASVTF